MILLTATTDKIQLITSAAVNVDVYASGADFVSGDPTFWRQNTAITTATTTDIVAAPASSTTRKVKLMAVRNKGSANVTVTVVFDQNGTDYELHEATLSPDQMLQYIEGIGFLKVAHTADEVMNASIADQAIGASTTAYLTGSFLQFPRTPAAGAVLRWRVQLAKTAAATAALSWRIKFGTLGTTSDTDRVTLAGDTETAVVDDGVAEIMAIVRGPIGVSCIVHGSMEFESNLTTTGFSNTARKALVRQAASAGFDITPVGIGAGLALVTGASHAITVRQVFAEALRI